jgi:excinuclease UvrABC nuclease subunit
LTNTGNQKGYYVYFYYNENDVLLYVGLSNDVGQRFYTHIVQDAWMSEAKKVGVRQYQNSTSMILCERYYIAKLKPKYNIKGSTKDFIDINLSDPVELELLSRNKFIIKYCKNKKTRKNRLTFKEELVNTNCNIVCANIINLFDESILRYNLDETAFLREDCIFYFNTDILNEKSKNLSQPMTNFKIQKIKGFFNNEERIKDPLLSNNIMPFNLHFKSAKYNGGYAIVSSMSINQERIVTDINFSDSPFINFSKNKLKIYFDRFVTVFVKIIVAFSLFTSVLNLRGTTALCLVAFSSKNRRSSIL